MANTKHHFSVNIIEILDKNFNGNGELIYNNSSLLQYLNIKTKAANKGSKSRAGFGNHYAIYVLVEDYLKNNFDQNMSYSDYEGARFKDLLTRQRELPFGQKLQNHALNHRLNKEFHKFFPTIDSEPILRDVQTNRYWFNEGFLLVSVNEQEYNIAASLIEIIDEYIKARQSSFADFMSYCNKIIQIHKESPQEAIEFISSLFAPNTDARIFEIVSYSVLKFYYADQQIYWGWDPEKLNIEQLILYKTGRTNANDGGIDFVMKPLGRFFQVTETIDAGKYFLDIDKIQRYPLTFVVKTNDSNESILQKITHQAKNKYKINSIVNRYISSIEEIINIPKLESFFSEIVKKNKIESVIKEIILQSKIEFNVEIDDNDQLVMEIVSNE